MPTHRLALLHAASSRHQVALFSAFAGGDGAPEWIYVMPARDFKLADGRGPFKVDDAAALIARSLAAAARLPIDQDHATEVAAKTGAPAPARGWIVALEVRGDAIWGRVEWTPAGVQLLTSREYRGFSPVLAYDDDGRVTRIMRGALTNNPALGERTALFSETSTMDWKAKLAELLGLAATATDEEVLAALKAKLEAPAPDAAAMSALAVAAGLDKSAKLSDITAAVATLTAKAPDKTGGDEPPAWAKKLEERIDALAGATAKDKATALVDGAISDGRIGVKPNRERWLKLAEEDFEGTRAMLAATPKLADGNRVVPPEEKPGGVAGLTEDELAVAKLTGVSPEDFTKQKAALAAAQGGR